MSTDKGGRPPIADDTISMTLRVGESQRETWRAAAELDEQTLSAWMRGVLDRAAKRSR